MVIMRMEDLCKGRKYSCVFNSGSVLKPDRSDKDLIGIIGTVTTGVVAKKERPAMIWLSMDDNGNISFVNNP